eukprot:203085_1
MKRRNPSTTKSLRNHMNVLRIQLSKLKQRINCIDKSKTRTSGDMRATILLMVWLLVCVMYLFLSPHALKRRTRTIYPKDRNIIYTNIGIVIPAKCDDYTVRYLDRILHNIYLSQMDFQSLSNTNHSTKRSGNLYFPSEVIISMSIMPPEYDKYEEDMDDILKYYWDNILQDDKTRLQMIYHHNITMNAAQNRNFGLNQINYNITEFIGFFDIDDVMHPQRISILYHVLNGNTNDIDFIFHSFTINEDCKHDHLHQEYLHAFTKLKYKYLKHDELQWLSEPVSDANVYTKQYCVAYYKQRTKRLCIFDIECGDQMRKATLIKDKQEYAELFTFDRFDHDVLHGITFINYTQLVKNRCANRTTVPHNINGIFDVDCDYGTMAGGIEAFRNEQALTR